MTALYVLDIPENTGVAKIAAQDAALTVDRVGPYFEIRAEQAIVIDRRATGCRHAVWYSVIAGLAGGTVVQHDAEALRVQASPVEAR